MRRFKHITRRIVELKPLAREGYQFDSWEVIKGDATIKENKFTMPTEDVEIVGKYSLIPYEVIVIGENGQQSGGGIYAFNQEVLLSQSANPGYNFDGWTSDFDELVITNDSFVMPSRNLEIVANYLLINYKVIIENDGNGNETGGGDEYHVNDEVRLATFPKTGYDFDKWEVLEGAAIIENNKFIMPAEDVKIKATYKLAEYSVTVNSGSVTSGGPFRMGDSVSLLEDQKIGYSFDGWEFDGEPIEVNQGSFVMPPRNVNVTAVYTAIEYNITVDGDNGTETASKSTATIGEVITLTASPGPGYEFTRWDSSDVNVSAGGTFTMPADNVTVTAVYTAIEYSITVDGDNGTGSSSGTATVGQTITLTSTPNAGYQFKEWQVVSPIELNIANNDTFTMPAENVVIDAVFEAKPAYSSEFGDAAGALGVDVSLSQDGKIRAIIQANKPIVQNYNTTNNTWENEWAPTNVTAYKVSLSADGTILAVGYSGFDNNKGEVVVYENNNGNWQQKGSQLTGEKGQRTGTEGGGTSTVTFYGDQFGRELDLSNDGLTMIIGSPGAEFLLEFRSNQFYYRSGGKAQVYKFQNGDWAQLGQTFEPIDSYNRGYGDEVKISGNGLVIAFTNYHSLNNEANNKLHVYEWASSAWVERTGVAAFDSLNQMDSGFDFSINSNGSVLSVGDSYSFSGDGSVKIYRYVNSSYSRETISAANTNDMLFGSKVDLDDSGNYCVISENYVQNISDSASEFIYVYHYSNSEWSNIGKVSGGAIATWGATETSKVVISANKDVVAIIAGGKIFCYI